MVYTNRCDLTIIELVEETDRLTFTELEDVLWKRPSNMIYLEINGELYGVIYGGYI